MAAHIPPDIPCVFKLVQKGAQHIENKNFQTGLLPSFKAVKLLHMEPATPNAPISFRGYYRSVKKEANEEATWARDNLFVVVILTALVAFIGYFLYQQTPDWKDVVATCWIFGPALFVYAIAIFWRAAWKLHQEIHKERDALVGQLAALQENPALRINILALYIQPTETGCCDVFMHVQLILDLPNLLDIREYKLTPILHGASGHAAWFVGSLREWGLITKIEPMEGGKEKFSGVRVPELPQKIDRRKGPTEGWLHFLAYGIRKEEAYEMIYRLHIVGNAWGDFVDIRGDSDLFRSGSTMFDKIPSELAGSQS